MVSVLLGVVVGLLILVLWFIKRIEMLVRGDSAQIRLMGMRHEEMITHFQQQHNAIDRLHKGVIESIQALHDDVTESDKLLNDVYREVANVPKENEGMVKDLLHAMADAFAADADRRIAENKKA